MEELKGAAGIRLASMRPAAKDRLYRMVSNSLDRLLPSAYTTRVGLAQHLREVFKRCDIDLVVDVGANEGQYRNFIRRRCGYDGLIVSYEPVAEVFKKIQEQAKTDPKWEVEHAAIGVTNGLQNFNVMQDSQFSSFKNPVVTDLDQPDLSVGNTILRTETVEVRTLDSVTSSLNDRNVYLKLDTQGSDFDILRASVLDGIPALQIELSVKPIYEGVVGISEGLRELERLDFELSGLFSVNLDRRLRVIEFDAIAIRTG